MMVLNPICKFTGKRGYYCKDNASYHSAKNKSPTEWTKSEIIELLKAKVFSFPIMKPKQIWFQQFVNVVVKNFGTGCIGK